MSEPSSTIEVPAPERLLDVLSGFVHELREGVGAQAMWKPLGAGDPSHRFGGSTAESTMT